MLNGFPNNNEPFKTNGYYHPDYQYQRYCSAAVHPSTPPSHSSEMQIIVNEISCLKQDISSLKNDINSTLHNIEARSNSILARELVNAQRPVGYCDEAPKEEHPCGVLYYFVMGLFAVIKIIVYSFIVVTILAVIAEIIESLDYSEH